MKKILLTIVIVLVIQALILVILIASGAYNVSTSNHDDGFVNWWLAHGAIRSVRHHARGITAPPLDNPAMIQEGFKHYDEMCVQCHGAPGKEPDEIAKGLWPQAPDLSKTAPHWTASQIFWITKFGIKFSAMPGWGTTHDDKKLWAITAFVQKLPQLSAADYQQMETNTVKNSDHDKKDEHSPAQH
jgi:mono/diheme cytochrome c family protein